MSPMSLNPFKTHPDVEMAQRSLLALGLVLQLCKSGAAAWKSLALHRWAQNGLPHARTREVNKQDVPFVVGNRLPSFPG